MITTFFALLLSMYNVIFNLDLLGIPLGYWFCGFICFDMLVSVLVFTAKVERGMDIRAEIKAKRKAESSGG